MGWVCIQFLHISWCPTNWFYHSCRQIFSCWCGVSNLWRTSHSISWCLLSSSRMGSYKYSVCSSRIFLEIPFILTVITSLANAQELFNLHHAMACNVVEWIFGILKAHFTILTTHPRYDLDIVAQLPPALSALHNFIHIHDPNEINEFLQHEEDPEKDTGVLANGYLNATERQAANTWQDEIAWDMWIQYQGYCC